MTFDWLLRILRNHVNITILKEINYQLLLLPASNLLTVIPRLYIPAPISLNTPWAWKSKGLYAVSQFFNVCKTTGTRLKQKQLPGPANDRLRTRCLAIVSTANDTPLLNYENVKRYILLIIAYIHHNFNVHVIIAICWVANGQSSLNNVIKSIITDLWCHHLFYLTMSNQTHFC